MKINLINSFKVRNSNNNFNVIKNDYKNNIKSKNCTDSISFGANELTYSEVNELKNEAYLIEVEAHNNLKTGYDLKENSKKYLNAAKKQYLNALSFIQAYYQLGQSRLETDNGAYVEYTKPDENSSDLQVDFYNEDGVITKTILAQNSLPAKIVNHCDGKANIYDYTDGGITVSKGVSLAGDSFGECQSIYSFHNGKISSINLNGQILSEPNSFEESYMYFNDKLVSYSTDNKIYSGTSYHYGERYVYLNDRLSHYYEDFDGEKTGGMNWKFSYHFANTKLMAKVSYAKQEAEKPIITPRKVIYTDNNGHYLSSNTAKILVSDFGGLTVLEQR